MSDVLIEKFSALRLKKKKALIIFLPAGFPDFELSHDLIRAAFDNGADIVELGIPFSDSLADGPLIQKVFNDLILKGVNIKTGLETVKLIGKERPKDPILFMISSTLVFNYKIDNFMKAAKKAKVSGLILPDIPVEEMDEFLPAAREHGIKTVMLVAPTSTDERLKEILPLSEGFVYYINMAGLTGSGNLKVSSVSGNMKRIRQISDTPIAAGFGISTPDDAKAISKYADGVIIGSEAIRVIQKAVEKKKNPVKEFSKYIVRMRKALDR